VTLPTPSQTVGPFFNIGLPGEGHSELLASDSEHAIRIEGTVYDGQGEPVPDALIEIWQADRSGAYNASSSFQGFGRCETDDQGGYWFVTLKPGQVPAPGGSMQAPHISVSVFARGLLKHVATRIYFPDEADANEADPVLSSVDPGLRPTLVAREDDGVLRFDIRLQGDGETVFFAI
jgi:protocatechuate 3,4-dioxygenase alpha subunit